MTKTETSCLLESDPAGLRGKPCLSIPVVRSAKAIPAHPIFVARNMTSPWTGPDDVRLNETQPFADCSFIKDDRSTGQTALLDTTRFAHLLGQRSEEHTS